MRTLKQKIPLRSSLKSSRTTSGFPEFAKLHRPIVEQHIIDAFLMCMSNPKTGDGYHRYQKLQAFSLKGKLLRGVFVILAESLYKNKPSQQAYQLASAIEIAHSGLLVHDDIIDNDYLRRGNKTIFAQYIEDGQNHKSSRAEDFGKSMGIIAGDIGIFLASSIISNLALNAAKKSNVVNEFNVHMQGVCYGEMIDIEFGMVPTEPRESKIIEMFKLKTSGYTFELPLVCGALLADAPQQDINCLRNMAGNLGIAFQIKDDELGLFGDSSKTGKPVGADIIQNKKTLFRARLFQKASKGDMKKLQRYFGNVSLSPTQVAEICQMIRAYGILGELQIMVEKLSKDAKRAISMMSISHEGKDMLYDLVDYNAARAV
ncbi:hypothetical protein A3I56_02430 [Candidatus Roizmanbacteria bacterium RIFCSPLOWO2_02_FULL_43_10]|uniref:Polyprenyl synthetase n=3 Tax=Candidatus Roizmaniibacteriota TaxID=1752723 RepID=A0A1F7JUQ0_9BACT|nr:MAG: hypothetical protein A3D08_01845 [Candidatus Roizmanbacteria bacterium RIFCSPHIGHO2_02_FULL_43_11]OGK59326.1 MAG: hypothetical protein A3I56_02430 [Candidatus Roizmanbacteria bacterium RIFCSPLOWO2_02_FULL_43_10]